MFQAVIKLLSVSILLSSSLWSCCRVCPYHNVIRIIASGYSFLLRMMRSMDGYVEGDTFHISGKLDSTKTSTKLEVSGL